jgi:hypothetical protein
MKNISNVLQMLKSIVLVWLITLLLFVAGDGLSNKLKGNLRKFRNELRGKGKTKKESFLSKAISFFMKRVTLTGAALSDFWARGKEGAFFNREDMGKAGLNNFAFILMAIPTPENRIIGILGKIPALGLRGAWAKEYIDACAVSTLVTVPPATIVDIRLILTNFNAAIDAPKKALWETLLLALQSLLADFQGIANLDRPNSISILESGNFKIKGKGGNKAKTFNLFAGAESGTVRLEGQAGGKKKTAHDWQMSLDNGVTWIRLLPTLSSETLVSGLEVGKLVWFAHQIIDKNGIVDGSYAKKSVIVQ